MNEVKRSFENLSDVASAAKSALEDAMALLAISAEITPVHARYTVVREAMRRMPRMIDEAEELALVGMENCFLSKSNSALQIQIEILVEASIRAFVVAHVGDEYSYTISGHIMHQMHELLKDSYRMVRIPECAKICLG